MLTYNKDLNDQIDANGVEELTPATNPNWWTGTGSEVSRGLSNIGTHAKRMFLQNDGSAADALGVNRYVTRDGKVDRIRDIQPVDAKDLPKFEKPDARNSGAAAVMLGDFLQMAPAMGAAVINPFLGGAAAASMGADMASQEADERGLKGDARLGFIGLTAIEDGIGGALPGIGGIGENAVLKYGSRFVFGGAVNEALSEGGRYSRAELLEANGYKAQAEQMRQWDVQAAMSNFIIGGVFNLAGGTSKDRAAPNVTERPVASPTPDGERVPVQTGDIDAQAQTAPTVSTTPPNVEAVRNNVASRMTREQVKQAKSDIVNSQRHLERIDAERAAIVSEPVRGSGKALAQARQERSAKLAELESQRAYSEEINRSASQRLEDHQAYNRSQISPENADAATHTVLHDNYVTESAPGLATDVHSEAIHVRAMDEASEAFHTGRAVDVSQHFDQEHEFIVTNDLDNGNLDRMALQDGEAVKTDAVVRAASEQTMPEVTEAPATPGRLSDNIEDPFTLLRTQAEGLREYDPVLADVISRHIDDTQAAHQLAHAESQLYDIAAACAIVHGN